MYVHSFLVHDFFRKEFILCTEDVIIKLYMIIIRFKYVGGECL